MRFLSFILLAWLIQKPDIRIPELERRIYELTNSERQAVRAKGVVWDSRLADLARAHSRDMAKRQFFDHVNPEGKNSGQRARAANYNCTGRMGENLASTHLYSRVTLKGNSKVYDWYSMEAIAANTVELWMKSSRHRFNLQDSRYALTGVGAAIDEKGKVLITQLFCGGK